MLLLSPAKLNIYLKIGEKRPDSYHNIFSIFTILDFGDKINIDFDSKKFILNFPQPIKMQDNLIYKTYQFMKHELNKDFGMTISVEKNIPLGSGMGGGSSNAATVIYAIAQKFDFALDNSFLKKTAFALGADIPVFLSFFLTKRSYFYVTGIGDEVIPLKINRKYHFLLVNPGLHISTKWAYNNFKKKLTNSLKIHNSIRYCETCINNGSLSKLLYNEFEPLLFDKYPIYHEIRQVFEQYKIASLITGSGATIFGVAPRKNILVQAQNKLKQMGLWTQICKTF